VKNHTSEEFTTATDFHTPKLYYRLSAVNITPTCNQAMVHACE